MDAARSIKALTECGAITQALKAEHYAIEDALQTLDGATLAGAGRENLAQILNIVIDFCVAHFASEEQEFRTHRYTGAAGHARAHEKLLQKFREARTAILHGQIEGTLDAADLLNAFHDHVADFDRAAHAEMLRQSIASGAGDALGDALHQQAELNQLYRVKAVS